MWIWVSTRHGNYTHFRSHFNCSCSQGILLKGGHVLDALASCHTIAFDKTGTLTTGELKFKAIEPIHGHRVDNDSGSGPCCAPSCEKEALAVAAAMEKGTTHPIGRYLVDQNMYFSTSCCFLPLAYRCSTFLWFVKPLQALNLWLEHAKIFYWIFQLSGWRKPLNFPLWYRLVFTLCRLLDRVGGVVDVYLGLVVCEIFFQISSFVNSFWWFRCAMYLVQLLVPECLTVIFTPH